MEMCVVLNMYLLKFFRTFQVFLLFKNFILFFVFLLFKKTLTLPDNICKMFHAQQYKGTLYFRIDLF